MPSSKAVISPRRSDFTGLNGTQRLTPVLHAMSTKILRQKELADELHVSERLIRKWQENRVIPYIKVNKAVLYDFAKVLTALEKFERKAAV
jgi:ribosome-binding protein aMBF1 (putative translation factor)